MVHALSGPTSEQRLMRSCLHGQSPFVIDGGRVIEPALMQVHDFPNEIHHGDATRAGDAGAAAASGPFMKA